jgi:glycosyltransferase involved in cell wall biosynthesis
MRQQYMHSCKITIITVCLNREKTIAKTFDSILSQTHPPYEYIIVDGASSDTTMAIAKSYEPRFSARGINTTIISEPDDGMYYAMNKAIPLTQGDWIHFLCSDDWYYENTSLEKIANILQNSRSDIVYGDMAVFDAKDLRFRCMGNVKPPDQIRQDLRKNCCIQEPASFYRKTVFRDRLFDTSFRISADHEHWLYLADRRTTFEYHPIIVAGFLYGEGLSTTDPSNLLSDEIRILLRYRVFNRQLYEKIRQLLKIKKRHIMRSLKALLKACFSAAIHIMDWRKNS